MYTSIACTTYTTIYPNTYSQLESSLQKKIKEEFSYIMVLKCHFSHLFPFDFTLQN